MPRCNACIHTWDLISSLIQRTWGITILWRINPPWTGQHNWDLNSRSLDHNTLRLTELVQFPYSTCLPTHPTYPFLTHPQTAGLSFVHGGRDCKAKEGGRGVMKRPFFFKQMARLPEGWRPRQQRASQPFVSVTFNSSWKTWQRLTTPLPPPAC